MGPGIRKRCRPAEATSLLLPQALQDLQQRDQRSANTLRLADMLLARHMLTVPDAQEMLGVTYHTAQKNIEKLVKAGVVSLVVDAKYGKLYSANEILTILS